MYIVYLPPNIDNENINDNKDTSDTDHLRDRDPQVMVKRVHKSGGSLIIYEIEPIESELTESETEPPLISPTQIHEQFSFFNVPTQITAVSSQLDAGVIRALYFDLNFTPIFNLSITFNNVNIFGVLIEMLRISDTKLPCTELVLFDFDIDTRVVVKLWRGLAAWHSSLSLGSRLQIRSLIPSRSNSRELHSCSSTEIQLLAHGPSGQGKPVSGRAAMLTEKEKLILNFLNHQSLLIPYINPNINDKVDKVGIILACPFYLEHSNHQWILQGYNSSIDLITVNFIHLDAKIWQMLSEIIDKISDNSNFTVKFNDLTASDNNHYNFMAFSSLDHQSFPATQYTHSQYKSLNWIDLCSSTVILYGVYILEASIDSYPIALSEESLGNLSILPDSYPPSMALRLKCPHDDKLFIYPDNPEIFQVTQSRVYSLLVKIKTVLNDCNPNEIIRRSVYVIKTV